MLEDKERIDENVTLAECIMLAENINTPAEKLEELSNDVELEIRHFIDGDVLVEPVLIAVAGNPSASQTTLDRLARHDCHLVYEKVAENPSTSAETLAFLAGKSEWWVKMDVAKHQNTTPDVLEKLAKTNDLNTIRAVAQNPHTRTSILQELARSNFTMDDSIPKYALENLRRREMQIEMP